MAAAAGSTVNDATGHQDRLYYSSMSFALELLRRLDKLRRSSLLCDVELVSSSSFEDDQLQESTGSIRAHRALLAAGSPYFKDMFAKNHQPMVVVRDVSQEALTKMVDFIYSGQFRPSWDDVEEMLAASSIFQVEEVRDMCSEFMLDELQVSNALSTHRSAKKYNCVKLADAAARLIHNNFSEVTREEEFLTLPKKEVIYWLSSDDLRVESEFEVLSAAIGWVEWRPEQRGPAINEVLRAVRATLIPRTTLKDTVILCTDEALKSAITSLHQDVCNGLVVPVQPRRRARRTIYAVGGFEYRHNENFEAERVCSCRVECFDTFVKEWCTATSLPLRRNMPEVAGLDNAVYAVGGEMDGSLSVCEVYIPREDGWYRNASMQVPRHDFGLCAFKGHLYAFGGRSGRDMVGSIERYDPVSDSWQIVGNMPKPARCRAVPHGGLIYILSGPGVWIHDLHSYDPSTGAWRTLAPMKPRRCMGIGVLDCHLYVVGGYMELSDLPTDSVETYSFEQDSWTDDIPLPWAYANVGVASSNGYLYVIGGEGSKWDNTEMRQDVARYDPNTKKWGGCKWLSGARCGVGVAVL